MRKFIGGHKVSQEEPKVFDWVSLYGNYQTSVYEFETTENFELGDFVKVLPDGTFAKATHMSDSPHVIGRVTGIERTSENTMLKIRVTVMRLYHNSDETIIGNLF